MASACCSLVPFSPKRDLPEIAARERIYCFHLNSGILDTTAVNDAPLQEFLALACILRLAVFCWFPFTFQILHLSFSWAFSCCCLFAY